MAACGACTQAAGVEPEDVTLHLPLLGLGFGRRLEVDYVAQAVRVAMDCGGTPAQLIGSREEDTANDFPSDAGNRLVREHRVVCAVDCGTVANPGIVAQQMEAP